jgi:hypothetical protein
MKRQALFTFDNGDMENFIKAQLLKQGYNIIDLKIQGELIITALTERQKETEAANPVPEAPFEFTDETAPPARTSRKSRQSKNQE